MALSITSLKHRLYITLLVIIGFGLLAGAAVLLYDAAIKKGALAAPSKYGYTINQSLNSEVDYVKNSFYPNGPEVDNTAHVAELTDTIEGKFQYSYKGSSAQDLKYTYSATASVSGTYGVPGGNEDISSVWSRHFELQRPVTKSVAGTEFSIDKTIEIPFSKYRKLVEDFRLGLALPVSSEMKINFDVKVTGTVDGQKFSDTRTSTLSTPLNVQVYQLVSKYDKTDTKELSASATNDEVQWRTRVELVGAALLAIGGITCIGFAIRNQRTRTTYQRQLEKIYRYHDGIIIRTSKPAKLKAAKTIIPVRTFEDILNLEEETKAPIIASPVGESATQFMIVQGDMVYVYTLGDEPMSVIQDEDFASIEASLSTSKTSEKPKKKTSKKIHIK